MSSKDLKFELERMNYQSKHGYVSDGEVAKFNERVASSSIQHNRELTAERERKSRDEYLKRIEEETARIVYEEM